MLENDVRDVQNGEGEDHFGTDRVGSNEGRGTLWRQEGKRKRVCNERRRTHVLKGFAWRVGRLLRVSEGGENVHVENNGTLLRVIGKCADELIGLEKVARYENNIIEASVDHFTKQLAIGEDIE